MILQVLLVVKLRIAPRIGTIDRLSIRIGPQVLPTEVPFKPVVIAESLLTELEGQF
jgi:hypothetical protein